MSNRLVVKVGSTMVAVGGGLRSFNIEAFIVGPYSFDQKKRGGIIKNRLEFFIIVRIYSYIYIYNYITI